MGLARALQKAGYGTRRQAESLVAQERVTVDGKANTDPKSMVGPQSNIKLDDRPLVTTARQYFVFHKPPRVTCTTAEAPGRQLVSDYFPTDVPGLNACGRMDSKTTGLMLLSNDLVWNNELATSKTVEQEYRVQTKGELTDLELDVIEGGIQLPKLGLFKPVSVKIVEIMNGRTVMIIVIREGKVRQMRRMFSTLHHQVTMMRRIRIGGIRLGDLPAGGLRKLTGTEVENLRLLAQFQSDPQPADKETLDEP